MNAAVAIITRTFERPVLLDRAIRSVLNQQFEDWVHVIVNDGGCPGPVDLLVNHWQEAYRGRCRVVHLKPGRGMQEASNAGIAACDSEFLCVHDDDDSWNPRFLQAAVSYLREPGRSAEEQGVVTQTIQVMEEFHLDGHIVELQRHDYCPLEEISLSRIAEGNLFPPIAFLYRRAMHDKVGLFNQSFGPLGDFDFNLRFLAHADIGLINQRLAHYHWRARDKGQSVTSGVDTHRAMLARMKDYYLRQRTTETGAILAPLMLNIPRPPAESPQTVPFNPKYENPAQAEIHADIPAAESTPMPLIGVAFRLPLQKPGDLWALWEKSLISEHALAPHAYAQARGLAAMRALHNGSLKQADVARNLAALCALDQATADKALALELSWWKEYLETAATASGECLDTAGLPDEFWQDLLGGEVYPKVKIVRDLTRPDIGLFAPYPAQAAANHDSRAIAFCDQASRPHANGKTDLRSSLHIGLARQPASTAADKAAAIYHELGRQIAGPLLHGFLHWIVDRARAHGKSRLYFLSRDGYYLQRLLEDWNKEADSGVSGTYLYGSRRLYNVAGIEKLDAAALDFLTSPNPSLRVCDFLQRLGMQPDAHRNELHQCGFDDPEEMLTVPLGGTFIEPDRAQRLRKLFMLLEQPLLAKAAEEREILRAYLQDQGFDPATGLIVDFGWQATSARALNRVAGNPREPLHALYFATWESARVAQEEGCLVESFFVHRANHPFRRELLRESPNLMEMLFQAPHPSIQGLRREKGAWQPVYSTDSGGGIPPHAQPSFEQGMEAFSQQCRRYSHVFVNGYGEAYAEVVLERLLREPEPSEAGVLGTLQHSEGFGTEICFPLIAERPPAAASDDAWEAAYQQSNWKKGFVTLITDKPRREAFRTREVDKYNPALEFDSPDFRKLNQNMENNLNYRFWIVFQIRRDLQKIKHLLYNPLKFIHYLFKPGGKS